MKWFCGNRYVRCPRPVSQRFLLKIHIFSPTEKINALCVCIKYSVIKLYTKSIATLRIIWKCIHWQNWCIATLQKHTIEQSMLIHPSLISIRVTGKHSITQNRTESLLTVNQRIWQWSAMHSALIQRNITKFCQWIATQTTN